MPNTRLIGVIYTQDIIHVSFGISIFLGISQDPIPLPICQQPLGVVHEVQHEIIQNHSYSLTTSLPSSEMSHLSINSLNCLIVIDLNIVVNNL